MPVTSFVHLPIPVARSIELGPLDHQRKLGESLPWSPTDPKAAGRPRVRPPPGR